jgi:hypothetical protein
VTSEVLPTIRKTRLYGHNSQQLFDHSDPAQLLKCLVDYTQRTLELQEEKAKLEIKLEAQTPVVNAYKRLEASEGSVCIQDAAEYVADGTDGLDACGSHKSQHQLIQSYGRRLLFNIPYVFRLMNQSILR